MAKKSKVSKRRRKNRVKKNRDKRSTESTAYEPLEPKHLLAAITVGNSTDLSNADTSSITALMANDGGDGISLREAITAANNTTGEDSITFDTSVFTGGDNSVIRLTQGELLVSNSLSIDATSVGSVVITGDANDDDVTIGGSHITDVSASFGGTAGAADDLLDDNSRVLNVSGTANLTLTDLTITGGRTTNSFERGGGILSFSSGAVTLNDSTVSGNSTTGDYSSGGGLYTSSGDISLANSTVSGNSTSGEFSGGGGVSNFSGAISLVNSTVSGNSSTGDYSDGGGIGNYSGDVSLFNSTLSGNSSTGFGSDGGGIWTFRSTVLIVNSTITANSTSGFGGGISFDSTSDDTESLTLHNSIVAGNTNGGFAPDIEGVGDVFDNLSVQNSLIGNTLGSGISGGSGNIINRDPLLGQLADNGGPTLTHALTGSSPAIHAGDNTLAVDANGAALGTDQRGENRISGGTVDIGAYEISSEPVSFVVTTNSDTVDAIDFETSLREAIIFANNTAGQDTITFDPSVFAGGDSSVIRLTQGALVVRDSLSIDANSVGGVVITGDANDDDVTIGGSHITDVSASDDRDLLDDNSRVLIFSRTGNLTLTGLTITGGRFSNPYQSWGGGITADGDVSLVNSTVSGNSVIGAGWGGGVFTEGNLSLLNSTVSDNSVTGWGGGGIVTWGDVSLVNSTVSSNSTFGRESEGGGILTFSSDVTLINSTVSGNSSTGWNSSGGGGILTSSGDVTLINSTFSGNSSTGRDSSSGGGISTRSGDVTLVNSTLSGNNSTLSFNSTSLSSSNGGGIYSSSGDVSLVNSTVTGNSASGVGGGISFQTVDANETSRLTLHNSIVAGNTDNGTAPDVTAVDDVTNDLIVESSLIGDTTGSGIDAATGTGNILNADPLLGPLADNGGQTLMHALLPGSPAIDGGNNALALDENGNALTTDQRGEPRIESGTVDIGAVESEFVDPFVLGDADLDGVVDFEDIPAFIQLLQSGVFLDEADINRNGIVDFGDIQPFIQLLISGGSSAVTAQSVVAAPSVSSAASLDSVSEFDQQETGEVDLLDGTFATYEDDLDVVFN